MATHKSSEKRSRQSEKRQARNVAVRSRVKTSIKKVLSAVEKRDLDSASDMLGKAVPNIAKAAAKGIFHKKNAARKISRLTRRVNRLESSLSG
ncbi:MAG: 30S ribosomal protein S20 [Syntrophobacterales bacterium]|nr:30S ribosomal protein S20 [Syntrophobacterales bacterium]